MRSEGSDVWARRRAEALAQLSHAFADAVLDDGALRRLVVERVAELTGAACIVHLLLAADESTLETVGIHHMDPRVRASLPPTGGTVRRKPGDVFEEVLDRGETTSKDVETLAPRMHPTELEFVRRSKLRFSMATPLRARGRIIGLMSLLRFEGEAAFNRDEEWLLRDLADCVALALENSRLFLAARRSQAAAEEAQRELKLREDRFRILVERSLDVFMLTSGDGTLLYASPAIFQLLGYEPDEIIGQQSLDYTHPDDLAHVSATVARVMADPAMSTSYEFRAIHRDGSVRWIEATLTNMLHDPSVQALVGNARDVTERRHARDELHASEGLFARLSESGLIGIKIADSLGNIIHANDTFLMMLGYSREELAAGKLRASAITPPEWLHVHRLAMEQLRTANVVRRFEKEYLRKDGTRVPVLVGIAALDVSTTIGFVADLTDRKNAERALRASEEQLRQAQKMDAIGRLAGGVAHDFNNVLSVVLSMSELIIADLPPDTPMRTDVEEIQRAGMRAAALTKQLLMFSRHEVVEPRVVNINEVVAGMGTLLQRVVGESVQLIVRSGATDPRVLADPTHIEQVIMNLAVNARDAMPSGGKLVIETANVTLDVAYVEEHLGTSPGEHVMLAVSDTGIGMDRATQSRIFEPFFTTKPKGRGTGLGLSTVFGIVRQSGGNVWVYSEPGRGTTLKVYFPLAPHVPDGARSVALPAAVVGGHELVLLVEDEDQVRSVARQILERYGYRVIPARDGMHALALAEAEKGIIDILVTDVVMPHISGPDLARRMKRVRPGIKCLCMSGYTDDIVVRQGLVVTGMAFLQKPFTPEVLARRVREVLDAE